MMGRLFWKFFFFILLAQLMVTLTIGISFWIKNHQNDYPHPFPPAFGMHEDMVINAAASTLQYGGIDAFKSLLNADPHYANIYVIDEQDNDILGRHVDPAWTKYIHQHKQQSLPWEIKSVTLDHHPYFVFNTRPDFHRPPPDFMGGDAPPNMPPPEGPVFHLVPIVAAVIASLLFAAILAWYFSKPIQHLRTAFKAIASGNFNPKTTQIMGKRSDELADLSHDVDNMAQQISTLIDGQQRLLHDVSHELRSPLARMQVLIGLARQQPEKATALFERIEHESFRMDELIDELLTLSRLEAGVKHPLTEETDIGDLLTEIIDDARLEAEVKHCQIDWQGEMNIPVICNPEMMYRAIENVVRNAVKHTKDNTTVTIESILDQEKKQLHLNVTDCGSGVPNNALEAIFKPFYRVPNAANRTEGYGIGLAIAQQVIKTYGGQIKAVNRPEGGLCVSIVLPVVI